MFLQLDQWIRGQVEVIVTIGNHAILPGMLFGFFLAVTLRGLMYFTVSRQVWFISEFHKRAVREHEKLAGERIPSFFGFVKKHLERTFYELFAVRGVQMRRRIDFVMAPSDRVFLVQPGCARTVKDLERNLKSLKIDNGKANFEQVSRICLEENPCFNKLFGVIPIGVLNDFLGHLPGFFILGGIFGTFLAIMKALPELGNLNLSDAEGTKIAMDSFVSKVGNSMAASVSGILLSVAFTAISSFWSAERSFMAMVDRLSSTLEFLWSSSSGNNPPEGAAQFDANRDPLEALAEAAVERELEKLVSKEARVAGGSSAPS